MALNPVSVKVDNSKNSVPKQQISFKGAGNPIIWMMDGISRGGFAANFVTQDMLGMALPRTAAGLTRNSNDTGKKNTAYAKLVAIREFLSGPSSFMIPAAILWATKKHFGRANDVPINYIQGFSDSFNKLAEINKYTTKQEWKNAFYKNTVRNLIENSTLDITGKKSLLGAKELDAETEKFSKKLIEMDNVPKKRAKALKNEFVNDFVELRKKHSDNPSNKINTAWFRTEKEVLNSGDKNFLNSTIGRFVNHLVDYTEDITNSISKKYKPSESIKAFVDNFKYKRAGSRFIANIGMTAAVISFFTIIPKIYNQKNGKNPALAGLTPDQAPPKSEKEVK